MSARPRLVAISQTDLLKALNQATQGEVGWVQAVGLVEDLEIRIADSRIETRRNLRGRFTLATLNGPFGGPYGAVVSRVTPSGNEIVAGQLVAARALNVNVLLTIAETDTVQSADAATSAGPAGGWAARVEASAASQKRDVDDDDIDEELLPEAGDLVHHFAFGLCEVLQEKGDSLVLRDVNKPGRVREIKIDMLTVSRPTQQEGKRLFHLTRRV